jgi:hypothetical protein
VPTSRAVASLSKRLTDPDRRSVAAATRSRRSQMLLERFPQLGAMAVVDLGGEVHTWTNLPVRPRQVTLLNLHWKADQAQQRIRDQGLGDWMAAVEGDACVPPDELTDQRFDLVFSNSVIEHVGGHDRRRRFAYWAQALGEHHWIQTPNRFFPIEPHWLAPGLQFAPPRVQAAVMRRWPIGSFTNRAGAPWHESVQEAMGIELLSPGALRSYFPRSELVRERVGGLTKSLIVVR